MRERELMEYLDRPSLGNFKEQSASGAAQHQGRRNRSPLDAALAASPRRRHRQHAAPAYIANLHLQRQTRPRGASKSAAGAGTMIVGHGLERRHHQPARRRLGPDRLQIASNLAQGGDASAGPPRDFLNARALGGGSSASSLRFPDISKRHVHLQPGEWGGAGAREKGGRRCGGGLISYFGSLNRPLDGSSRQSLRSRRRRSSVGEGRVCTTAAAVSRQRV